MSLVADLPETQTSYIPVSVTTLRPDQSLGIALYLRESRTGPYGLYRDRDIPLSESDLESLLARGTTTLFAQGADYEVYQRYLRDNLPSVLGDESVSVVDRFSHLNEVVRDVLADSFRREDTAASIAASHELAWQTIDIICRKDAVASDILGVLYHDYQTFTHSANVAYYCVLLAKALGLSDRHDLHGIAVGALLHDLGKLEVPDRILNKPGPLTSKEMTIVQQHPRTGFLKLCRRHDLSTGQLMMVYQHHERLDGRGYPVGQTGRDIHEWAALCAIADVYEALTSNRPYRSGLSQTEAFEIMGRDAGPALDKDMFACWMQAISTI